MPMGLNNTHKTNVTAVVTDLTAAIDSLSASDNAQAGVKALLSKFRTELLEVLRHERTQ